DGGDSISRALNRDLKRSLLKSGVKLSAVVFYDPWAATEEERQGPAELEEATRETGGFYTSTAARDLEDLDQAAIARIDLLARLSNHQYKLVLKTPGGRGQSVKWKLQLKGLPLELKRFKSLYPRELPVCGLGPVS